MKLGEGHTILVGKTIGKRPLGRPRRRKYKMDFSEVDSEVVRCRRLGIVHTGFYISCVESWVSLGQV
jgi:hypothetical protein